MKRLQPVVWSKGTFLSPQHLQSQDRFIESALQFRLGALNFRPWGFSELRINQQELAAGNFAIYSARGILPDGLPFDIPDSDPPPPLRPLAPYLEAEKESLDVFLALPHYQERGLNVAVSQRNTDTRYRAEVMTVRDENTGMSEKLIQVARKNFRLLMEGESREGTSALQIANVKRTSTDSFQVEPRFVPPVLDIAASDYLLSILRRLVEILAAKSSILGGMRRQKNQSLADFTSSDIANFWLLYTVNSYFPLLNHLFETKKGHPEGLFSVMTSMAGALTAFSIKLQPRDLPAYDHEDLGRCFTDLDEKLRELLETTVPTNVVSLPLKLVQPSVYATALADDKYLVKTRMYLAISAETKEAELIKKVPSLVKVCSATHIDTLIRQALPGIQLTHSAKPPGAIPVKVNYQYFSLNQAGAAWEAVNRARNFAAYVPADFPNPQLELIILLPEAV
jgi:type VI secretion system protein ImpJ